MAKPPIPFDSKFLKSQLEKIASYDGLLHKSKTSIKIAAKILAYMARHDPPVSLDALKQSMGGRDGRDLGVALNRLEAGLTLTVQDNGYVTNTQTRRPDRNYTLTKEGKVLAQFTCRWLEALQ